MVTESDAKKFQEAYKIETGQEISSEESFECIRNLVELLRRVYRPIKKKDYEMFSNKLRLKPYGKTTPNIYRETITGRSAGDKYAKMSPF